MMDGGPEYQMLTPLLSLKIMAVRWHFLQKEERSVPVAWCMFMAGKNRRSLRWIKS